MTIIKKYKKAVKSKLAVQYCKFPAVSSKKSDILLSPKGCVIAAVNRNMMFTAASITTGSNNTEIIKKMPKLPKEFLIKTLPATAKSNPPDKNPPTIGMPFPMAYFAALRAIPS